MAIFKKGTCQSSVTISSMVYVCNNCGYTEMSSAEYNGSKTCPKCNSAMTFVSSSHEEDNLENESPDSV